MKRILPVAIGCLFSFFTGNTQTQSPVYLSQTITNANVRGFYRYLPADYNSSNKTYPLILWIHGAGQVGSGNSTQLPRVLQYGVPKLINDGVFPSSFVSGDSTFSFVIISPQFQAWPTGSNVAGMLAYIESNYRINAQRIYLMGISAGGGAIMDYASISTANSNKIAAMIPFCGTYSPTQTLANRIASTNLPLWFFHNTYDGTVPVAYSRNWKNYINGYNPSPVPPAKLTEFPVQSSDPVTAHECWSLATTAGYKPEGINIYQWLLNYKRNSVPANIPPFANAGPDEVIALPSTLLLNGSASSDADGTITAYKWAKITGPPNHQFSDSTAANTTVSNLSPGNYIFQLTVWDNRNASATDQIQISVIQGGAGGTERRILIDAGPPPANGGALSGTPDNNGNHWNNMTDARAGVRVSNARTITNQSTTIGLEVVNRIDGTYNTGGNGMNNVNNVGAVGIYPSTATNDYAFAHNSATNGRWKITGLQPGVVYNIKFWGTKSYETRDRDIEIKLAADATWKSYSAAGNTNFNNAAVFTITGVSQADFDIRAKSPSIFGYINVIDITYTEGSVPGNQAPLANAGSDMTIILPQSNATLNGCSSSDPENAALQYSWRRISGNTSVQVQNITACDATLANLTQGSYQFELTVTDTGGLNDKDTVAVTVNTPVSLSWPVIPAPICNDAYKIVVLGSSTSAGTGASPADSSWVRKFTAFAQRNNAEVTIHNLALGGLTSYHVCPTGTIPPAGKPQPDVNRNISAALSLNPDAIIINLPTNDAASAYSLSETQNNFNLIAGTADAAGVPIWVTTSQPRNSLSAAQTNSLIQLKDWVILRFGNKAIDFWTTIANSNGTINATFDAGDGIHLNNYGHHIIFSRAVEERIWDTICLRRGTASLPPVAAAGADRAITLPDNSVTVSGASSYDPDGGTITVYSWTRYSGPTAGFSIAQPNSVQTVITFSNAGVYGFRLGVTDNSGATAFDSIVVTVNAANVAPIARAGADRLIQLPANNTLLDGRQSTDGDGNITSYSWTLISGPGGSNLFNPLNDTTTFVINSAGTYVLRLTVTDNGGLTSTDDVTVQFMAPAAGGKRINVNLYEAGIIYNNASWNNWQPSTNVSSAAFKYSDGSQSTVSSVLSSHARFSDNGVGYGAGAAGCPPEVLRMNSIHTINRTLTLSGLTAGNTYDLEFYGSRAFASNSRSIFRVGSLADTINTDNNVNDYAKLNGVLADNAGRIIVMVSFTGTYNYIAGFSITESLLISRKPVELNAQAENWLVYPNPFSSAFNVKLDNEIKGKYSIVLTDLSGKILQLIKGVKVNAQETVLIRAGSLNKGIYRITLVNGEIIYHQTISAY